MPMGYLSEKIKKADGSFEYRCVSCKKSFGEQHPMFHNCPPKYSEIMAAARPQIQRCEGIGFCMEIHCPDCNWL